MGSEEQNRAVSLAASSVPGQTPAAPSPAQAQIPPMHTSMHNLWLWPHGCSMLTPTFLASLPQDPSQPVPDPCPGSSDLPSRQ